MESERESSGGSELPSFVPADDFQAWSRHMWGCSSQGTATMEFLRRVTKLLLDLSGADAVEVCLKEDNTFSCYRGWIEPGREYGFETIPCTKSGCERGGPGTERSSALDVVCGEILHGRVVSESSLFTKNGVLWDRRAGKPLDVDGPVETAGAFETSATGKKYASLALIPLEIRDESVGLLTLKSVQSDHFRESDLKLCEEIAQTLSVAFVNQRVQAALRERVKELACLYRIARLEEKPDTPLEEILQGIADLLPPAWQYPELTSAKIVLDGMAFASDGYRDGRYKQSADIVVSGERRGIVNVSYSKKRPDLDEGPFMKEERSLIEAVATQVALLIERRQAEDDKLKLREQLRHADRLATIGQLAAGVAHELNEPLGSILGFAQLTRKHPTLPAEASEDIDKIIDASLHAREIIRKLLLFSRQRLPSKAKVSLNRVIEEGLYFFKSRCERAGIELVTELSDGLPHITADPVQLHQALVNLVVNAIQAMPEGGRVTIRTGPRDGHVFLTVRDTGVGMSDEVRKKIFIPFFTTKDVREGTGLGLAVVHGIVTSHVGSIEVESKVGQGSSFTVQLPVEGLRRVEDHGEDGISG